MDFFFFFAGNPNFLTLLQQLQLFKKVEWYLQNTWGRILLSRERVTHKTCSVLNVTWKKKKPNGGFYELPLVGIFSACNLVRYLCTLWPRLFACQGDLYSCCACGGILQLLKVLADCEWWEMLRNVLCLKQLPLRCPSLCPPPNVTSHASQGRQQRKFTLVVEGIFLSAFKEIWTIVCLKFFW